MRQNKLTILAVLLLLLIPQVAWGASANTNKNQTSQIQISDVRFAPHTDAQTGKERLQVVIDVTGPVAVSASLSSSPLIRLTLNVKGAAIGKVASNFALAGNIASDLTVVSIDKTNTQLTISLPTVITNSDYNVYTLPADPKANKLFRIVININKPTIPTIWHFTPGLKGKVIAIDPGHGGSDAGAVGPNHVQEKAVTLAVALKVKDLLQQSGATVYMTRLDDRDVYAPYDSAVDELSARALVGNRNKADVFLDIHANSFSDTSVGGTATYYYQKSKYDQLLAQSLQSSVTDAGGLNDRGISSANFYVLKHTIMPSALVELAFISNPNEEKLLNSSQFQQKLAQGLVNGLNNFFIQASK